MSLIFIPLGSHEKYKDLVYCRNASCLMSFTSVPSVLPEENGSENIAKARKESDGRAAQPFLSGKALGTGKQLGPRMSMVDSRRPGLSCLHPGPHLWLVLSERAPPLQQRLAICSPWPSSIACQSSGDTGRAHCRRATVEPTGLPSRTQVRGHQQGFAHWLLPSRYSCNPAAVHPCC